MDRESTEEAKIYIFNSEYQAIIAEAQHLPNKETGGDLYGTFTHGYKPIIWLASGPGPKARGSSCTFEQDFDFTTNWEHELMISFGIQYIGSWHSHHFLGIKQPSQGDIETVKRYAINHARQTSIDIIVTHDNIEKGNFETVPKPYFYPEARTGRWVNTKLEIIQRESPIRHLLDHEEKSFSANISWKDAKKYISYHRNPADDVINNSTSKSKNNSSGGKRYIEEKLNTIVVTLANDGILVNIENVNSKYKLIASFNETINICLIVSENNESLFIEEIYLVDNLNKVDFKLDEFLKEKNILKEKDRQNIVDSFKKTYQSIPRITKELFPSK